MDPRDLRRRLVEGPGSAGERCRARRWERFAGAFPAVSAMSVMDLGGTVRSWLRAPVRPASLHIVNLAPQDGDLPSWIRIDQADACDLPPRIIGGGYDLVFSNSVIEHVGGYAQRQRFADAVHKLAASHWVQTPYRYFPVEPHWLFPGFQFLPLASRAEISRRWPLAPRLAATREEGLRRALAVELLSRSEMEFLFPGSAIWAERVMGLPKSLIAVKSV
jgi:hypothetical protein